jgi:hypothetical protein
MAPDLATALIYIVEFAGEVADAAMIEMEKRWAKI